jgi:hypothetical protein
MRRLILPLLVAALSSSLAVPDGQAQTARAGIVTAVHGTATIARASSNQSNPLRFKDDVFLFDRVTTGERSLARILLGGRAVVTARERSILTITAVPGTATLDLESGRLLLAVAKGTMRPGESIDIKTRNAIIGIRGTVVVADFVPGQTRDGSDDATVFTILRGAVEVSQIDPVAATAVGAPLHLGALQSVKVTGLRAPEVNTITAEQAKRLTQGFSMPIRLAPESAKEIADLHANQVERELSGLLGPAPVASAGNNASLPSRSPDGAGATNSGASSENGGAVSEVTATVDGSAGALTGTVAGVAAPVTGLVSGVVPGVAAPVSGLVSGVTAPVTGLVPGVTAPVTGLVSGVTSGLTSPPVAPAPTPAPPAASAPPRNNSGGLIGGLLKTTGPLLK